MNQTIHDLLILLPVLLISMSVHEVMHAVASYKLGDDTAHSMGRISWNPFVHIDPVLSLALPLFLAFIHAPIFAAAKPVQVNFSRLKYGEFGGAIVGAVGPASNLALAFIGGIFFRITDPSIGSLLYEVLSVFVYLNVILAIFNSIPWPPLDGSRVLYAFAPRPLQEFMESIERMGLTSLLIFIFLFFYTLAPFVSDLSIRLTNWII